MCIYWDNIIIIWMASCAVYRMNIISDYFAMNKKKNI